MRKSNAIIVGIVCGAVALGTWLRRDPAEAAKKFSSSHPDSKRHSTPRGETYVPWAFGAPRASDAQVESISFSNGIPFHARVRDENGAPVPQAVVEVRAERRSFTFATMSQDELEAVNFAEAEGQEPIPIGPIVVARLVTKADGSITGKLPPGISVALLARADGGREGVGSAGPFFNEEEGAASNAEVEVAALGVLAGAVTDESGRPVGGVRLSMMPRARDSVDHALDLAFDEGDAEQVLTTSPDGTFRIPVRRGGAFDVAISHEGFQPYTEPAVQVMAGRESRMNVTLLAGADIAGIVLDPDGNPVEVSNIEVRSAEPGLTEYATAERSGEPGRFRFPGLAPGRYVLHVNAEGYRSALVKEVETGARDLAIRLSRGGKLEGDLTIPSPLLASLLSQEQYDQGARLRATVRVSSTTGAIPLATGASRDEIFYDGVIDGGGLDLAMPEISQDGHADFSITSLPPGEYAVAVLFGRGATLISGPVHVYENGTARVSIHVPMNSGAIAGVVRVPNGNTLHQANVTLHGPGVTMSASTEVDGRFEFPLLPPGNWTLDTQAYLATAEGTTQWVYVNGTAVTVRDRQERVEVLAVPEPDVITVSISIPETATEQAEPPSLDFMPSVHLEGASSGVVFVSTTADAGGQRLHGGDRVVAIDGVPMSVDNYHPSDAPFAGAEGSMCRLSIERPATGENFIVEVPRNTPVPRRYGCRLVRDW